MKVMTGFRIVSALAVFWGAGMEMTLLWHISDVLMGGNGVDQHSGDPDTVQYCSKNIKRLRNTDSAEKESCIFQ